MRKAAREYYQSYVQYESSEYREVLDRFDFHNCKILDVGCGVGTTLFYIRKRFEIDEGLGIDSSRESISSAENDNVFDNVKFICGDMFEIPLTANYFDYILSFGVLHYYPLQDVSKALFKMTETLKNEGTIILFLFKPHVLHSLRKFLQAMLVSSGIIRVFENMRDTRRKHVIMNVINPPAFYIYPPEDFMAMAGDNGLEIEDITIKQSHILPYLLPFNENISDKAARLIMKMDVLNFLSFGNYYILAKGAGESEP